MIKLPALDKQAHFLGGIALSCLIYIASGNLMAACVVTATVAALWEILGQRWGRECSWADWAWSVAGIGPMLVLLAAKTLI